MSRKVILGFGISLDGYIAILAGLVLVTPFALSVMDVNCRKKQTAAANPTVVGARDTRARSYNRDTGRLRALLFASGQRTSIGVS
jgi:hypothetical protein